MMKKPTTKKLPMRLVKQATDSKGNPFRMLFPDEKFYQYPRYPDVFVSQYANVITTYKDKITWRTPYYNANTGYTTLVISKRGKRKIKGIHELVAEVWLAKPTFTLISPLDVHHNIKVKNNLTEQPICLNFAVNLQYVYRIYHPILDSAKSIRYFYKSRWRKATEVIEIANACGVSEYSVYQLLNNPPTDIKGNWKIYESDKVKIKIQGE